MRYAPHLAATVILSLMLLGCGGGGGSGGGAPNVAGGSPGGSPAYVNGTTTGQAGSNDLGYYLGARTVPTTVTAATPDPQLKFDILNGYSTTKSNVTWRVLKNGVSYTSGTVSSINGAEWKDITFPITPGAGSAVYRIEIDWTGAFSEANENNNWVEVTVTVPAAG